MNLVANIFSRELLRVAFEPQSLFMKKLDIPTS
jgi:hypothetical protein